MLTLPPYLFNIYVKEKIFKRVKKVSIPLANDIKITTDQDDHKTV